jgi:DNA mismatch repair protein MutS
VATEEPKRAGPTRRVKTGRALQGSLFAALPDPMLSMLRDANLSTLSGDEALEMLRLLKAVANQS